MAWTTREHPRGFPGNVFVWPEYNAYVGVVPVPLLALAAIVALVRPGQEARPLQAHLWLVAGLVWCALGKIPGFSLFGLLQELPVFRSLRVPSRFLYPATMAAALLIVALRFGSVGPRNGSTHPTRAPWPGSAGPRIRSPSGPS